MPTRPPRRGSRRARLELSAAAFAPAFGLMALRAHDNWFWIPFAITALVGMSVIVVMLRVARTGNQESFELVDISDTSSDVLGHIGSYLAVAVIDPSGSSIELIIGVTVLALIFAIHVSVGLVHVNPLLYLVGYRVYSARTSSNASYYLIARSDVADWTGRKGLVKLHDSILIEVRHAVS